jgi:hypothetical protein
VIQAITFPTALNILAPGSQFKSDAVSSPTVIDCAQGWYWSARWQQMEKEADEDISTGNVRRFDDFESFFADLDGAD